MHKLDLQHISKAKRTRLKDMTVMVRSYEATEIIKENTISGETPVLTHTPSVQARPTTYI